MELNDCEELIRRLRIEKPILVLRHFPLVSSGELFQLLHRFHDTCLRFAQDMLFEDEFVADCRVLRQSVNSEVLTIWGEIEVDEQGKFLHAISELQSIYTYWWLSLDLPPSESVFIAITKENYRMAEELYSETQFSEFKRLMIRLSREFGIEIRKVQVVPMGKPPTFQLVKRLFKQTEAFNDFERSLRGNALMSSETRKATVRSAFRNEKMTEKIIWTGTVAELSYLVKGLIKKGVVTNPGQDIWSVTLACFEISSSKGKSFSDVRRSLREAKKPSAEKMKLLDVIIGHFQD